MPFVHEQVHDVGVFFCSQKLPFAYPESNTLAQPLPPINMLKAGPMYQFINS